MNMSNFKTSWSILQENKENNKNFPKKFLTKFPNNVKVYLIDGKYVRNHFEVDFIGGGHFYVPYKFIPENEIWLEQIDEGERELDAILLHEFTERMLMKYRNYSYKSGHNVATEYEKIFRKTNKNDPHRISDVLNSYFEKYFPNDPFFNNEFSDKIEHNFIDIKI